MGYKGGGRWSQAPSVTVSTRLHLAAPGHETNHSFSGPAFQHFDSVDGGPRLCWTSGLCISSSPYSAAGIVLASIAVLISVSVNDHSSTGVKRALSSDIIHSI